MANVVGYNQQAGKLRYVRAKEPFYVGGRLVNRGDYVQLKEGDAKWLVAQQRAALVTDEEAAAAQASAEKPGQKAK